jgi:hypothetical protein
MELIVAAEVHRGRLGLDDLVPAHDDVPRAAVTGDDRSLARNPQAALQWVALPSLESRMGLGTA